MKLVVFVICAECRRQIELRVDGEEFDIAMVEHDCDAVKAFKVSRSDRAQLTIAA